jgi:Tfp pilus assembly protein PilF
MRGLIAHQLGRPDEAVVHLTQAVAAAPAVASVHHALAEAYRELTRQADAERHYRQAAKLQPNAVTLLNLGNILMTLQRPGDAAVEYQSALRFDGRLPETHYGLGRALAALGRKEAADVFGRAIGLRPDFALAHEGLIEACLAAGAWDAAWRAACAALLRVDTPKLRSQFISAVSYTLPASDAPGLREAMQRALTEHWTRPQELARAACAVVALRRYARRAVA